MLIVRRPDHTIEIQVDTWGDFRQQWMAAEESARVLIDDPGTGKRPAVYRAATPETPASYVAISPRTWSLVRSRQEEAWRQSAPRKRERLCAGCRTPLTVARETTGNWVFRCDVCKSSEIFGKDMIGGTIGSGEREGKIYIPGGLDG